MSRLMKFLGIIPPVPTIFKDDGSFDTAGMALVIDHLVSAGVDGMFFLGTGGEFSQMSHEERLEVAEFAVRYTAGRVPVLIGTGSTNTREAVGLSRHAQSIGASGVVAINPYYWKVTEENLLGYFSAIANSVELPVLLYNFPALTGQDLYPEFVKRLVDAHPNIVGLKDTIDSVAHLRDMVDIVKGAHPEFSVFCGYDDHLLNTLLLGGDGAISASANFAPNVSTGIYRAVKDGDLARATALHRTILQLPRIYKVDVPFVGVVKEAMKACRLPISSYSLPPAAPLSEDKIAVVRRVLTDAGII
ncbi:putative 2-keto-3-deoxy-galactonate aldolase YagE [Rhizobium wenxiniae]|uniref:4-hydroxy-tetrahydrodipicolinate synthase n=1 Tax=Rhizobium wenxiniae TaxID=1737357 RepID=A0A7X0D121_9HYPH|nr:dihydrodipicolinate synthase family protein [Rhizobium wenxiniae]MBB6163929.1 4-hydroxy-tetrahydrodipicolinate synthase [Rhizobium wenxiniae]GGG03520.1 putative 2-keto-3-deoxy-galactonate aldolase YagE [Rhizobium wenxiniae]